MLPLVSRLTLTAVAVVAFLFVASVPDGHAKTTGFNSSPVIGNEFNSAPIFAEDLDDTNTLGMGILAQYQRSYCVNGQCYEIPQMVSSPVMYYSVPVPTVSETPAPVANSQPLYSQPAQPVEYVSYSVMRSPVVEYVQYSQPFYSNGMYYATEEQYCPTCGQPYSTMNNGSPMYSAGSYQTGPVRAFVANVVDRRRAARAARRQVARAFWGR